MASDPTFIIAVNQASFLRNGIRDLTPTSISADSTCTICLDNLDSSDGGRVIQIRHCSHAFHHRCLVSWFRSSNGQHNSCPICRVQLFPNRYDDSQNQRSLSSEDIWEDYGMFDDLSDEESEPEILGTPIFMSSSAPPRPAFEQQDPRRSSARNTEFNLHRSGSDPLDLRGTYAGPIRSNVETEQVRQDIYRAVRATDGFEPLPACLLPQSEGAEYIPIAQRRRQQIEERIRTENPNEPDYRVQEEVNRQWSQRTQFMRDLEQLESIHGFVVPFLRAAGFHGDELRNRSHLTDQQYRAYGALLNRVMPREVFLPEYQVHLSDADQPVLADEVRHFFPLCDMDTVRMFSETTENLRLIHFVASGASRHYIRPAEGRRTLHTPIYNPPQFLDHRNRARDAPGMITNVESPYPSHRSNPTQTSRSMLEYVRSLRSTPSHTPMVIHSVFRHATGSTLALGTSNVYPMPRGPNAESLMNAEYLPSQWQPQNATISVAPPANMNSNVRGEAVATPAREELSRDHGVVDIPNSEILRLPPSPAGPNTWQIDASSSQRQSSSPGARTFGWNGFIPYSSVPASHHAVMIRDPNPAGAMIGALETGPARSAIPPSSQQLVWGFARYRDLFPTMNEADHASPFAIHFFQMPAEYVPIYNNFRRRILGISPSALMQLQFDRLFPRVATMECLSQATMNAQAQFLDNHRHDSTWS
ncbi:hypothetical protein K505DRAFT_370842 [Melanomma pulvis-pyrius CBS 109.77]|uniref:RING-type domain-containing protein n=1 Tax=Melanomma pulvis-pyrius CBS 109.77 TaxID=1314802 RepID=A0A6A6XTM0_9PLEO|nr:hypothetical protein K505DRAFT_370842 [Melanomma pulvis-pyrius CBS 109.77]